MTPDGTIANHVVMTLIQKRGVRFKVDGTDVSVDESRFFVPDKTNRNKWGDNASIFRGGCSLIYDLDQLRLRYVIRKDIDDRQRMIQQFQFEQGMLGDENETYFNSKSMAALAGPFAFAHSHGKPQ